MLSAVVDADWMRLTHYLEARFPELKAKNQGNQVKGAVVLGE